MPTLEQLLGETMLVTAVRAKNQVLVPLPLSDKFTSPRPNPITEGLDEDTVSRNPIWRFSWDPSTPAKFTDVTIRSRGMGMNYAMAMMAFERVEYRDLRVTRLDGDELTLPLSKKHVLGAWWTKVGQVPERGSGLWQLGARLDSSIVVAFGWSLEDGALHAIDPSLLEDPALMPPGYVPPRRYEFVADSDTSAWLCVGASRYVAAVELVLCKENNDFVPGGIVGFARCHPHLLFWSNEELERAEVTLDLVRPKNTHEHKTDDLADEIMKGEIKALVVADTNNRHVPLLSDIPGLQDLPLPYTDVLYDYYNVEPFLTFAGRLPKTQTDPADPRTGDHPLQKLGEVTLADGRFKRPRLNEACVKRTTKFVLNATDVLKEARQGQFDNVHLAPRMKLRFSGHEGDMVLDDIVMLNACMHDCTHIHVRWSSFLKGKIVYGFSRNGQPNAEPGAPMVPPNQTVFANFPNQHALAYRAVAEGVQPGQAQVVCHHGLAYAVDRWPTKTAFALEGLLLSLICQSLAAQFDEPWQGHMPTCWSTFYWRIRYTGDDKSFVERHPDKIHVFARSTFDLERCMR
jgi:hypothetical protein